NLQVADTVINLEVPWNPAVLEQRIARVHRMGQHRPVQVFNLVMRDSIEERVLRVLQQKRNLFNELFSGTGDEISLDAMGRQTFLDAMKDLFAPPPAAPEPTLITAPPLSRGTGGPPVAYEARSASEGSSPDTGGPPVPRDDGAEVVEAAVRFLEALAAAAA